MKLNAFDRNKYNYFLKLNEVIIKTKNIKSFVRFLFIYANYKNKKSLYIAIGGNVKEIFQSCGMEFLTF
jgi:RNase adaptor protein for sRNA GlmZ degradation